MSNKASEEYGVLVGWIFLSIPMSTVVQSYYLGWITMKDFLVSPGVALQFIFHTHIRQFCKSDHITSLNKDKIK